MRLCEQVILSDDEKAILNSRNRFGNDYVRKRF
jgi:hypothetical protein